MPLVTFASFGWGPVQNSLYSMCQAFIMVRPPAFENEATHTPTPAPPNNASSAHSDVEEFHACTAVRHSPHCGGS